MNSILYADRKNEGRKPDKKLEPEKNRVYAQKPLLKMPFKNSISIHAKMIRCANAIHRKCSLLWKNSLLFSQYWEETEMQFSQNNSMFKRKKNVDRHGPRPLVNNHHLAEHPFFHDTLPLKHFPCLNYKYICTSCYQNTNY